MLCGPAKGKKSKLAQSTAPAKTHFADEASQPVSLPALEREQQQKQRSGGSETSAMRERQCATCAFVCAR